MTTTEPMNITEDPELFAHYQAQALDSLRAGSIHEENLLRALFPPPEYNPARPGWTVEEWREQNSAWTDRAYGGAGIRYAECYACQIGQIINALKQSGHRIEARNNGYNSYTYILL